MRLSSLHIWIGGGLQDQVGHLVVGGAAAQPLDGLPVVAADVVFLADLDLVDFAEPRVAHHLARQQEVGREQPALEDEQAVLRLRRRAAHDLRVVERERHRRLEERPVPALERRHRVRGVVDGAGRDVHDVDVALVEHVGELAEHPAVRVVLRHDVAPFLREVARRHHLEERGVRLEHGIVGREHRPAETHQGDPHRRALVVNAHFFTISVMACRIKSVIW